MESHISRGVMFAVGLAVILAMPAPPVPTPTEPNLQVPPTMPTPAVTTASGTKFGQINSAAPGIVLTVEDTKVKIRRSADVHEIVTTSNCPSHWNVQGNVIRQ